MRALEFEINAGDILLGFQYMEYTGYDENMEPAEEGKCFRLGFLFFTLSLYL